MFVFAQLWLQFEDQIEAVELYRHFCGETFFQHRVPIDASSLVRWRKRIGEEGVLLLLSKTAEAGGASGAIEAKSAERVIVDATGMEKAVAYS